MLHWQEAKACPKAPIGEMPIGAFVFLEWGTLLTELTCVRLLRMRNPQISLRTRNCFKEPASPTVAEGKASMGWIDSDRERLHRGHGLRVGLPDGRVLVGVGFDLDAVHVQHVNGLRNRAGVTRYET